MLTFYHAYVYVLFMNQSNVLQLLVHDFEVLHSGGSATPEQRHL